MKVFIASVFCALTLQVSAQKVSPFKDANSGKFGFKDETGKTIISPKYVSAETFSEGLAAVSTGNENYGYIDLNGTEVIPLIYHNSQDFKNGFALVTMYDKKKNHKRGFVDKTGKLVVPIKYDELYNFSDGVALFQLGKKYGFLDENGQEISSSSKYDYFGYLIHGRSLVVKNGKSGYIDKMCKEVIPLKYDNGEPFTAEGYGKVRVKDQYFLIDTLGNQIANAGFNISAKVNVVKDRWVVVTSKNLEAKESVYFLTPETYGKTPAPFGASITWQIIDDKNNVIKEARAGTGSFGFRVPRDGIYTVQAYYDMNDCTGCRREDKPSVFTMGYSFNTKL